MRSSLLHLLTVLVLVLSACSSTTVVARNDRPAGEQASTDAAAQADEAPASTDSDTPAIDDDQSETAAAEDDAASDTDADSDRGSRDTEDDGPQSLRDIEEADGFGLGGAEQLQGLSTDCESGNDMACDILFELSAFDTDEEAMALSCGGRSETTRIFCTEGVTSIADELVFDIESEGLDAIVSLCEGGDLTACDFLYFRSPFDSTFEEVGATCGNRVEVAVPDCRTFLSEDN